MADQFDEAQKLEELAREMALKVRRPEGPAARGECLWCGEPVEAPRRWCGAGCRDAWEKLSKTGKSLS